MDLEDGVEELQKVADFRKAQRLLGALGWPSLLIGVLNCFSGWTILNEDPIFGIIILGVGGLQIAVGLVNLIVPVAEGVLLDGLCFFAVGACHLLVLLLAIQAGIHTEVFRSILFGLLTCSYGIYRFASYGRFRREFAHKPLPEDIQRLDALVKELHKANLKQSPDVIAFTTSSFFGSVQLWRGRLGDVSALFSNPKSHEALIAYKDEVTITQTGKLWLSKKLKAKFQIGDRTIHGMIEPQSFEKYEDWKLGPSEADEISADIDEADPA